LEKKRSNIYEQYTDYLLFAFQNTANLALEIAIQTGGTIRELIPDKNYYFDLKTKLAASWKDVINII